jgi:ABC-type multidrug transport system fused ATPase/permease subunit
VSASPSYRRTFARLLAFLRPYKLSLVVSVVLAAASQAAQVVLAFLTGEAVGRTIRRHDHRTLWLIVVAVVA